MIVVPAGRFKLGSPEKEANRDGDEGPRLVVKLLNPFAVGKFEVTFAEWDACVDGGGCNSYKPSDQGWGRSRRPVINVSWYDAKAYIDWLSKKTGKPYRLLSEAEWEYVARARTSGAFWWGGALKNGQANYDRSAGRSGSQSSATRRRTMPVESFRPNGWGLFDVHGNVWEWVADCWYASYRAAFKSERVTGKPALGSDCKLRVMRGGGWNSPAKSLRSANRARFVARNRYFNLGFRVARTIEQ
jgi:formylglycine-generating enzyme required for sulfatase activity